MSTGKYLVYATIIVTYVLIVWGAYLTAGNWGGACGNPELERRQQRLAVLQRQPDDSQPVPRGQLRFVRGVHAQVPERRDHRRASGDPPRGRQDEAQAGRGLPRPLALLPHAARTDRPG